MTGDEALDGVRVVREASQWRIIEILEYPSTTGCFRARCSACGKLFRYRPNLSSARHSGAQHLWSLRGQPHSAEVRKEKHQHESAARKARDEEARKARCPTPQKKGVYASQEAAREHIRKLYRNGLGNPDYTVYMCACGYYHVGHSKSHLKFRIQRSIRQSPKPKRRRR